MSDRALHDAANAELIQLLREALEEVPTAEVASPPASPTSQSKAPCGAQLAPTASLD
ncbi:hypothetical protein HNQ09_001597 [Deinococcus budaensis]|uniref:Uncharacterized protein n=1 Tax=Deinococcus budaensis TaxID=1665626 RepID=A0A7W8GEK5_9DEIO|nr:hypothetical protein [Deinococcus budaensis]